LRDAASEANGPFRTPGRFVVIIPTENTAGRANLVFTVVMEFRHPQELRLDKDQAPNGQNARGTVSKQLSHRLLCHRDAFSILLSGSREL